MMPVDDTALAVGHRDADVVHHALILVIQNVAMQDEISDIALVAGEDDDRISPDGPPPFATFLMNRVF